MSVRIARTIKKVFSKKDNRIDTLKKQREDYDFLVRHGVETELGYVSLFGHPIISMAPGSRIRIGKGVVLVSDPLVNTAGINHPVILATLSSDAEIIIEDNVGLSGVSINCVNRCEIRQGAMLGANVNIWDTDFHSIDPQKRSIQQQIMDAKSSPIIIKENVWIGANSTVLKGVTIGENTVVGAMSLVNKSLPNNVVCAGIPARKVKDIIPD